jgi:hypothetical protein
MALPEKVSSDPSERTKTPNLLIQAGKQEHRTAPLVSDKENR